VVQDLRNVPLAWVAEDTRGDLLVEVTAGQEQVEKAGVLAVRADRPGVDLR